MLWLDGIVVIFNDTATTEIYTLSLHDALPISCAPVPCRTAARSRTRPSLRCSWRHGRQSVRDRAAAWRGRSCSRRRSEEHTSELQSRQYLVCRLLLEKKN